MKRAARVEPLTLEHNYFVCFMSLVLYLNGNALFARQWAKIGVYY